MSTLVHHGVLLCVGAGVVAGFVTVLVTADGRAALRLALDFWLAAGLLRLALPVTWQTLLAAASILAVRQIAGPTLWRSASARRRPFRGRRAGPPAPGGAAVGDSTAGR